MLDIFPPAQRGQAMAIWVMGVVVGPIMGPTLGGYLTDFYNWRWVFYINLPFGILAIAGLWVFLRDTGRNAQLHFDLMGFSVLGLGLGALQLMLDRGEFKDWFGSTEIIVYAVLCGLGFYLFLVHMFTAKAPLIPPRIFRDMNFSAGLAMIFAVGMLVLATAALLAPYLQVLAGRSVVETGLLLAPRGVGNLVSVIIAGRLSNRVDPRLTMFLGILLIAESLWEMTGWTPDIDAWSLSRNGIIQGFGLGLVFTPLQVVAFSTLPAEMRTDGTALFSLLRNVGLAIGVSVTSVVLTQSTQIMHAQIAANVTSFNRNLQSGGAYLWWSTANPQGLAALNAEVTRQAAIIAYVNDFKLLFIVSLLMLPLLLMMSWSKGKAGAADLAAAEANGRRQIMKLGIVGTGNVGCACAMAAAIRGSAREIVLVNRTRKTADAVATDIRYGTPLGRKVDIVDGDYDALSGAGIVLVTAGVNEKTGGATDRKDPQGRLRLLAQNAKIYRDIVPKIVAAAPDAVLLVVTDPPDPLADVARQVCPGATVLSAGTFLDSQRFRVHLGRYFDADPAHVEAQVIGDHGTSQVFLWSSARVGGVSLPTLLKKRGATIEALREQVEKDVRYANITIIEGHDASQYGIGIVSARIAEMVLNDEHAVIPIGSLQKRFGVTLSLPSVVGRRGVIEVLEPEMSDEERQGLEKSAQTLRAALASLASSQQ